MRTYIFSFGLVLTALSLTAGCGSSESNPAIPAAPGTLGTQAASPQVSGEVSQVAQAFLEALRTGNSALATSQLTPTAQQAMRSSDMDFQLLANNAASYQIGGVEMLEANEAIVETVWSEPDGNGQQMSEQWTLALQLNEGRWGILGIVADSGTNQPPMVMDFENPGKAAAPANTAATPPGNSAVPQQATLPPTQDPFRQ